MVTDRQVVLHDVVGGLVTIGIGTHGIGLGALLPGWWVGILAFAGSVGAHYAVEHRYVRRVRHPWYAVLAVEGTVLLLVVFGTDLSPMVALSAVFVGSGIAEIAYRFGFGVVRPVPETRRRLGVLFEW